RIVQRELDKIDHAASTYRVDSDVSKFNKSDSTDWFDVSYDVAKIVDLALDVSRKTSGAFDVTVAPLVNLYRFGPNKSPLAAFPSDEEIDALRARVGYEKLEVRLEPTPALKKADPALTIDLSSVAKGYAVDLAGQKFEELGLKNYMVEVGGEVRCAGEKFDHETREPLPWVLGVQKPKEARQADDLEKPDVYRVLNFAGKDSSAALATSGDYNNAAQVGTTTFSHFVDPRTGKPVDLADENDNSPRLGSVSVVSLSCDALSCAQADAFATAFFVLGADEGIPLANKLSVAALYVYRLDPTASTIDEKTSETFEKIDSSIADEQIQTLN
ncbi:MAG: FAD:protein FMN transferase, partial [Planctomycetia bacterium]|nr:FAD:protein FMN transferase [Planctomycetia bacterium]